jgi:hypothetical protein
MKLLPNMPYTGTFQQRRQKVASGWAASAECSQPLLMWNTIKVLSNIGTVSEKDNKMDDKVMDKLYVEHDEGVLQHA